jgi:hypothetical protein
MILLITGLLVGGFIGYSIQHEIKFKKSYDIHIECRNEEDMKTVINHLKNKK